MKPILSCSDVRVTFHGFHALQGVTLDIEPNEIHFLIGPNGAGKTTLLDTICGKTKPSSGDIMFGEQIALTKKKEYEIARLGVKRKFQTPSVFLQLTVQENLELAVLSSEKTSALFRRKLKKKAEEKVLEILSFTDLYEFRGMQAGSLSHGQKQWLEIGMQLVTDPQLLLLDEPIAGMSGYERERTGKLIHDIAKKCAVVTVEHDMDFVKQFSQTVTVMSEGKVLCKGTMEEIQQNKQVAEIYLGRRE
ncbi:urea ABC transporter ATP-binding protein UrtD [Bacillus sp. CECT 9360]|uniref:urea ABC transporter ATP-binding protein UrtD n=1 Tax=Bacillus sp. CECT 9360 TaxID=2845821 RepID=UPI001E3588D9|nr:urea ABC transporter ATP-binding protein UrtD [Bacillus sp. CECT 9360]CAH0346529.1 High-affinity branched-chain amino acid transport ATP-binding protein LivF [Bacillus sp. CECT 9360]